MMPFFKRAKKELGVPRKKKKIRKLSTLQFQLIVGVIIAIVIALLFTAVFYATRIDSLQITKTEVVGGETIPHSIIEGIVETQLQGTYLHLIPKRFIPFYPKDGILRGIKSIDRVKNVRVEMAPDRTLSVVFDEYVPYALWCAQPDSSLCLFIDASGFAFAQAPALEGSAFVRYVEEGRAPQVKTPSFDADYMQETGGFVEALKDKLSLYATHVTKMGTYDVDYTISGGGVIKVSQSIPMEESFKNLESILHSDEFAHIEPGMFQYIDLRFGDKVFVNEAPPGEAASTTASTTSNTQ